MTVMAIMELKALRKAIVHLLRVREQLGAAEVNIMPIGMFVDLVEVPIVRRDILVLIFREEMQERGELPVIVPQVMVILR